MLEFKNKYSIENHKKSTQVEEQRFFRWTNKNFYRTAYNDMRSTVSSIVNNRELGTC
jgi:hypothetical protein